MVRRVVFVLGGPGAGKTTLCASLSERWPSVTHISAGDLLRAAAVRREDVRDTLAAGRLVPPSLVCGLVAAAVQAQPQDRLCLLDGFPREVGGLELWEREGGGPRLVLLLEAGEELRAARCVARAGRKDDVLETVRTRMRVYREETEPLQDVLRSRGLVRVLDAEEPKEAVLKQVEAILQEENLLQL